MQFTTVMSKEKDYDLYLKLKKTGSQQLEARKKCYPPILNWKKQVPSYFEPDKHCLSYLERENSGSLLFGDKKCCSQLLGTRKKIMTII